MEERTWERIGALAGIGFVVLMVLATFMAPQQPRIDSSAATTLKWIHGHRTGIQTEMVLGTFAAGLLLWFVGHLRHVLGRAEGGTESLSPIVFGSGIGMAIIGLVGAFPIALLAFMDAQAGGIQDATLVRMLADAAIVIYGLGVILTAVFLCAAGIAMLRKQIGAPWLGWVSLVVAALNALAVITSLTFSTYHGAGWAVPGWAAYIGFLLVVLVTGISMLRQASPTTAPSTTRVLASS